jgi:hypothetical protein
MPPLTPLTLAMTDVELADLRRRAARECGLDADDETADALHTHWNGCACRQWALAVAEREVTRLREREAALLEIADMVAHGPLRRESGLVQCVWCDQAWGPPDFAVKHLDNCVVNTARMLLASSKNEVSE